MASPDSIRRAMLEGALHKAKDAVHADNTRDYQYAVKAYGDACAMLARVMERSEKGSPDWVSMEGIVRSAVHHLLLQGFARVQGNRTELLCSS